MIFFARRRALLLASLLLAALPMITTAQAALPPTGDVQQQLAELEKDSGGRLGVFVLNTETGAQIAYRADERFAFCSTFKMMLVSAVLARSAKEPGLLAKRIHYTRQDIANYSPIAEKHVDDGMTVEALSKAALQYSDNTAANQLMKLLGGPSAVQAFARSIGDNTFQLERWETALNSAIPGELRDTTTPMAMGTSLYKLTQGDALPPKQRDQLQAWMRGNTTGDKRIRAGVPGTWQVADKTGSGDYGTTNDIAVLYPPMGKPMILAVYFTQNQPKAAWRDEVIAAAARIVSK